MRPAHVFKALIVAVATVVVAILVALIASFERDGKVGYSLARLWARFVIFVSQARLVVRGLENVDPERQYVFMANHRSNADIPAILWSLRDFQLRWVAKVELLRVPFFGWGLRALKNIIVDRSDRDQAIESYRRARERIARGISVMVFPEGTRGEGDELLPFKKGGFVFAMETGTPIVPIALRGTADVMPRKGWTIDSATVEVVIGRPISVEGRSPYNKQPLMEEVRREMQRMMLDGEPGEPEAVARPA